ncbi:hypothetical protein [Halopiger djelfimassiliensis]|uniref:hypothetical protein n=1 Tax=Halopiger djelfimassiliensis TaxID=1293047 RepID=UPI000677E220|nr:hypothetical protein [Halopiger djelfimassiliensis]
MHAYPDASLPAVGVDTGSVTVVVSLLLGGAALHAGVQVATDGHADTAVYASAVLTALLGALAWAVLEPIPIVGGALALLAWVAVVKRRYRLGWLRAVAVAVVKRRYRLGWLRAVAVAVAAWAAAVVARAALEVLGIEAVTALGVPGT